MLFAHYWTDGWLHITTDIRGNQLVQKYRVSGKREANRIARELGAQPWNF